MRNLLPAVIFCFSWIIYSCEYDFSESNFVELSDTLTQVPVIDVTGLTTGDTIDIFNEVSINYNILLTGIQLYKVEISLNENLIYEYNTLYGSFLIDPRNLPNGISQLSIKVLSNRTNGTLASIYQKDTLYYSNSWVVNLDGARPLKNNITNVYFENGTLKIKWEKYPNSNFKAYYLTRNYKSFDDNSDVWPEQEDQIIAIFHDRDSIEFTDSSFVGGKACYYLTVENQTKSGPYSYSPNYITKSDNYVFTDNFPVLSYQPLDDGRLILKWSKSRYYRNVDKYVIQSHLISSVPEVIREFALTDTFAIENYGVPYENRFGLSLKSGDSYKFCSLLLVEPITTQLSYHFQWISFDNSRGYYYLRQDLNSLQIINTDYSLIKSKEEWMAFGTPTYESSMNGTYIAGVEGSGVAVYKNGDITSTPTGINAWTGPLKPGSVTNQGFVNYYSNPVFAGNEYRYHGIGDLKGDSIIIHEKRFGLIIGDLSLNSHYYAVSTIENLKVYSFDTKSISEILSVNSPDTYTWLKFSKKEENLLYVFHLGDQENKIEVRSANQSFGIVNEYPVQATQGFCYDPATETISGSDENYMIYVYNAMTGEEIIRLQSYYAENYPLLFNGTLFFRSFYDWDYAYTFEIPALHEN